MSRNFILSCFFLFLYSCTPPAYKAGDIYSIDDGAEKFSVVKVLAVDNEMIHIRIYKQKFSSRPSSVDPKILTLGTPSDSDGFGIGHIPLDKNAFKEWEPELIMNIPVTEDELEGYKMWKENQ